MRYKHIKYFLSVALVTSLLASCGGGSSSGGGPNPPPPPPGKGYAKMGDLAINCVNHQCTLEKLGWVAFGTFGSNNIVSYKLTSSAGGSTVLASGKINVTPSSTSGNLVPSQHAVFTNLPDSNQYTLTLVTLDSDGKLVHDPVVEVVLAGNQ